MLSNYRTWLQNWPKPGAPKAEIVAWLDQCPLLCQVEGPMHEWATHQGGQWKVDEYRSSIAPTYVGILTTEELYSRWEHLGPMGIYCLRPGITTENLHRLVTTGVRHLDSHDRF